MIRTRSGPDLRLPPDMTAVPASDWRAGLPPLRSSGVTLRELTIADAHALHAHLSTRGVARFISPPPTTVEGFERFIAWTHAERVAGRYVCYTVAADGSDAAIGLFQIRQLLPSFEVAEWGFALGETFWGTGTFAAAALAVASFAFTSLGVRRLEARSSVLNGRGNGALRKIGAVREAELKKSFVKDGIYHDQLLWAINAEDWRFGPRHDTMRLRMA